MTKTNVVLRTVAILLCMVVLTSTLIIAIDPVSAQDYQIVLPGGMRCSKHHYYPGEQIYVNVQVNRPLHRAYISIQQQFGPSFRIMVGNIWPGFYQIPIGREQPPPGPATVSLMDGFRMIAICQCFF